MKKAFSLFLLVASILLLLSIKARGDEKPITIDVLPKVVMANPYKATNFRVKIRVAENPDNRILSYSADCGGKSYAGQQEVDRINYTIFFELKVAGDCYFQACVHRIEKGKHKAYCAPFAIEVKPP